jgi:hypothetical protein
LLGGLWGIAEGCQCGAESFEAISELKLFADDAKDLFTIEEQLCSFRGVLVLKMQNKVFGDFGRSGWDVGDEGCLSFEFGLQLF